LLSVFPVHAPSDAPFAQRLASFLEAGCDVTCFTSEAAIEPRRDLLTAAERGLSTDILILLLSGASTLRRWAREIWEPLLFAQAEESGTRVAVMLLDPCEFPQLLRRKLKFFDATENPIQALRLLKRWLLGIEHRTEPLTVFSADLEPLYAGLADRAGQLTASADLAQRFAREASHDFAAVLQIPAHGRTLAQIAGELGAQLGMVLDGPLEENCRRIRELLSAKRCLVIFDAPVEPLDALLPAQRSSILISTEPIRILTTPETLKYARELATAKRFAEAWELLRHLFDIGADPESCARELVWICEHWEWYSDAAELRAHFHLPPSEQLSLF
jgi:hypothetical protein